MTRRLASLVICACFALPGSTKAADQGADAMKRALSSIPAEAMGFFCVPNLKELDADYQQAINNLGLQMFVPPPANSIISLIKQNLPLLEGLDETGPLAVVFMPAQSLPELQMKQAILIPTKQPKAMIEALKGQAGEGGLWNVSLMGQPAFAAIGENRLIVAASADVAKAIKECKTGLDGKLKPEELKALAGLDLVVWIDGDRLFKLVKPMVDGFLVPMMMMQSSAGPFEGKSAQMNKKQIDMFFEGAASLTLGVSLDSAGVGFRFALTSKPGSELAKQTKLKTTAGSLLQGLPAAKYMMAFGETINRTQATASLELMEPLFSVGEDAKNVDKEKVKKLKGFVEELVPAMAGIRGIVEGLAPGPDGLIGLSLIIDTTDSKRWLELIGKVVDVGKEMLTDAAKDEAAGEEIQMFNDATSFTGEAEDIAGVKVGHLKLDISKIEDAQEEWVEEVTQVIGKDGMLIRMAPADAKTVVFAFGGGKAYMGRLLEHARKKESPLDSDVGIKKVGPHLPEQRASVGYFAVDQIVACIKSVMTALDEEVLPIQMPTIDAPLAVAMSGGDGWMQGDLFIPTELLVAGKNAAMMMMGSMMAPPGATAEPVETEPAKPEPATPTLAPTGE